MSIATFCQALDFLERSQIDQVRLLGGEPTLHPDFPVLVKQVMERGFRLLVFSNGFIPEASLCCLERTPFERTAILVNVTPPEDRSTELPGRHTTVFQRLGSRVTLGINLYTPVMECDFVLRLIHEYHLSKTIRLGLAHPSATGDNHFLHPSYYPTIGQKIYKFAINAAREGVILEFDCGFVPCMFSAESLKFLGRTVEEFGNRCSPILDILPDGRIISCYPLAELTHRRLSTDQDASWMRSQFNRLLEPYRSIGIFQECSSCALWKAEICTGGCLSTAMQRWRQTPFAIEVPRQSAVSTHTTSQYTDVGSTPQDSIVSATSYPKSSAWVIPYIDQPLSFWEALAQKHIADIKAVYVPFPSKSIGSGRPTQPSAHLDEFLRHAPFACSVLLNPLILPAPVDEVAPDIIEALRRLRDECGVLEATVTDLLLAKYIREALPDFSLTASVLMDIAQPNQAMLLQGICDALAPASRIMREISSLSLLREAFPGRIRLIVNEACLPGCPFRTQHFYEMGQSQGHPHSLCQPFLTTVPWMRLTGAWVLPQHLHLYDGLYDELKLAGRVTLRNPATYLKVLTAYIARRPLFPNEIGGGPASVLEPMPITQEFFEYSLKCGHHCHICSVCQEYYRQQHLNDEKTSMGKSVKGRER